MELISHIKRCLQFFSIALLLFFICSSFTGDKPGTESQCDKKLEKIKKYYNSFSNAKKMYCKFSVQSIENGETGEKLITEIWMEGNKMKYENIFLTVLQDENTQVLIIKESQKIIIRNTPEVKDTNYIDNGISTFIRAENLKKLGALINCSNTKEAEKLIIDFPKKSGNLMNPLKQMVFEYMSGGEVKKVTYDYYMNTGHKTELYEYLKITEKFEASVLTNNVVNKIFSGNKLLKEYKEYTVQNLKSKQN